MGSAGPTRTRFVAMKVGVLQFFSWPGRKAPLETVYQRAIERIEIMDRTGYDAVWLAEHHFNSFSVCPSVTMMGMQVAARTVVEGTRAGGHRSPLKGQSVDFKDHRPYVPGDDTRHLDWKVLGRRDRLVLKRYEAEIDLGCHLVVDGSASMAYQGKRSHLTKYRYASILAASASWPTPNKLTAKQPTINQFDAGLWVDASAVSTTSASHWTTGRKSSCSGAGSAVAWRWFS